MTKKVLIVDDANFMRRILSKIVKNLGFEVVDTGENGEEAVEKYKELNPDFVTMDITMPKMSGIEAIKTILEYDPKAIIIACSAMGQKKVIMEALDAGAKDFIVKPFQEEKVVKVLESVLDQEEEKFLLNVEKQGEGAVKAPKNEFTLGEETTLFAKPAPGYNLKYWEVNGEYKGKENTLALTIEQNTEVLVVFEAAKFELNVTSEQGEVNIAPEKELYEYGDSVTLSAEIKEDWDFIGWKENGEIISKKETIQLTIEEDKNITAAFDYPLQLEINKSIYQIKQNQKVAFEIKANYYDNSLIEISHSDLPKNAELINISNNQARFYWQPNYNQSGIYEFDIIAQAQGKDVVEKIKINVREINNFNFKFNPTDYGLNDKEIHNVYLVGEFNNWGQDATQNIDFDKCPQLEKVNDHWEQDIEIKNYDDINDNGKCDFKWLLSSENYLILPEGDNLNAENSHFTLPDGKGGFHFYLNLQDHYDIDPKKEEVDQVYLICESNNWNRKDKTFALESGKNNNLWRGNFSNLGDGGEFKWVVTFKNKKIEMHPKEQNLLLEDEF